MIHYKKYAIHETKHIKKTMYVIYIPNTYKKLTHNNIWKNLSDLSIYILHEQGLGKVRCGLKALGAYEISIRDLLAPPLARLAKSYCENLGLLGEKVASSMV